VSELAAAMVGAGFGDEDGIEADQLLRLADPSALAAGRAPGEPRAALQRLQQPGDYGGVLVNARMADEVEQPVLAVEAEQQAVDPSDID